MNRYYPERLLHGFYMVGEGRLMQRRKVGYCRSHCDGHRSPEDAIQHFMDFLMDNRLELRPHTGDHATCEFERCENKTEAKAVIADTFVWSLCQQHLTREAVRALFVNVGAPMLLRI